MLGLYFQPFALLVLLTGNIPVIDNQICRQKRDRHNMGVQCEVYIASQVRAKKYNFRDECDCETFQVCACWDENASETYDYIENYRIYTNEFAQLLSVLRGVKFKNKMYLEFERIKKFSDEGPWIEKVPDDLPKLLALASPKELKSINAAWVDLMNEGRKIPRSDRVIYYEYLMLLQDLCRKSVKKRQRMYLWTCL